MPRHANDAAYDAAYLRASPSAASNSSAALARSDSAPSVSPSAERACPRRFHESANLGVNYFNDVTGQFSIALAQLRPRQESANLQEVERGNVDEIKPAWLSSALPGRCCLTT